MNGNVCESYDPDEKFRRLKIVEFPCVFVGLQNSIIITLEDDLHSSVYLRTNRKGKLMSFDDAQKVSPSHRAFDMKIIDNYRINITFKPSSECISWAKVLDKKEEINDTFVYDLRIIKMDGKYCCRNESHYEVSRYYICGQFEYCNISHSPKVLRFGDVPVKTKVTKIIKVRNESSGNSTRMEYIKSFALDVVPPKFTLGPISTKRIRVTVKPTSLNTPQFVCFLIRNKHSDIEEDPSNFLTYKIKVDLKVMIKTIYRDIFVESLHKLYEKNREYTYCDDEIFEHEKKQAIALNMLDFSKSTAQKRHDDESNISYDSRNKCVSSILIEPNAVFCEEVKALISTYDMINIFILPLVVDFGLVAIESLGASEITITNDTNFNITVKLLGESIITFSETGIKTKICMVEPFQSIKVDIICSGLEEGNYEGTFSYTINDVISRAHAYKANVCSPMLLIEERLLKFGMVTTDSFVTSAPIRLKNPFNIPIKFHWEYTTDEAIFAVTPESSSIPKHSTRICDVTYLCKQYKAKIYLINLISMNDPLVSTQIELNFLSKKHQVKFSEQTIYLKDVPLNLKTTRTIMMQNLSKEIAFFNVVDMQMPGLQISPLNGMMFPKSIVDFSIEAQLCCVMEFHSEIQIKINNKDTITLALNGNVVEPEIVIRPKQIVMPRIPSYMINYTQVTIQNKGSLRSLINIINNEDAFKVYIGKEFNKPMQLFFYIEPGQSKTLYIQIYQKTRREYNYYVPVQINEFLGPPSKDPKSTEFQYYTKEHEKSWAVFPKVKVKPMKKDISYCHISGIITMPLVEFSLDSFEIYYNSETDNTLEFTLTNVSKDTLPVTILLLKLAPFSLNYKEELDKDYIETDVEIKVSLNANKIMFFKLQFSPITRGDFTSTAVLFLDERMETPYSNLTFYGRYQVPVMTSSVYRVIFPPSGIGVAKFEIISLKTEGDLDISTFSVNFEDERNLSVEFVEAETVQDGSADYTIARVKILVSCEIIHSAHIYLFFYNENGAECDVELSYNITNCPLTLHSSDHIGSEVNPYPYYPTVQHNGLYQYMEHCVEFLEVWMFQQGFRKELYPQIPNTFHITSNNLSTSPGVSSSTKHINVTFMNFLRRIVGPLINNMDKEKTAATADKSYKEVLKLYNTYGEITSLLQSRGCMLWTCQAKFLLSYHQFLVYKENVTPTSINESMLYQTLSADEDLYNRLNKQCWLDLILQFYKEFILECCFFDCTCVSGEERDIIGIIIKWYNAQIKEQHHIIRKNDKGMKVVTNLSGDLSDCIALTSAILNYCPFLKDHFSLFCEVDQEDVKGSIITNACLIIEALNILKISFPLKSTDFLKPNLLQMLFLSVHLYIVLPMFKPREIVEFHPPLLKSSQRSIAVFPALQENVIFNFIILNNHHSSFAAEKAAAADNSKKLSVKVKYTAYFVKEQNATLLVYGFTKTRLYDTFAVFELKGVVGSLNPLKKCKLHGQLYRPSKAHLSISSPFQHSGTFKITITNEEPKISENFEDVPKPHFHVNRLNLIDDEINLAGSSGKGESNSNEQKVDLQIVCMSVQTECAWLWFRSEVGEFFITVAMEARWEVPIGSLLAPVHSWRAEPCQDATCQCGQETVIILPHRNELMNDAVRYALQQHASDTMLNVFDNLIESNAGRIVLGELFDESGTNMSEVGHILKKEKRYRVSAKGVAAPTPTITLKQHSTDTLAMPIVITDTTTDKYSITLTSECGYDIRTYKIILTALTQCGE